MEESGGWCAPPGGWRPRSGGPTDRDKTVTFPREFEPEKYFRELRIKMLAKKMPSLYKRRKPQRALTCRRLQSINQNPVKANQGMTINHCKKRATGLLAASALLSAGTLAPLVPGARAADPYDAKLEKRVEALERELNLMSGDSKGKNPQTYEVPTFMRALGKQVQELTIQGEIRFRYQYDNRDPEGYNSPAFARRDPGEIPQSRYRWRLRMNLNYKFSDNWFAGVGIQAQAGSDSTHQTYGQGFDNTSFYLNLAYLGWKINDNITLLGGKILAPFYNNTDRIVDFGDIRPGGLTERFNFDITPQLNLKLNFGQYPFYANPENGATTLVGTATTAGGNTFVRTLGGNRTFLTSARGNGRDNDLSWDPVLFYQDVILTWKPNNKMSAIVAPAFYFYPNNGAAGVTGSTLPAAVAASPGGTALAIRNDASTNDQSYSGLLGNVAAFNDADATRNLFVGMLAGEFNYMLPIMGGKNLKFFGTMGYNFAGGARAYKIYGLAEDKFIDKSTATVGVLLGELKKKGDWYITTDYGYVGIGSIDPNLNDPNFGMSRLNQQGFRAALGYNFYAWLKGEVVYYNNWNLEKNLHNVNDPDRGFTGGRALLRNAVGQETTPRVPFADTNAAQILQVQMTANF
jgi:hypothetical protein